MADRFQDCIDFANENLNCYFASAEGDQPRVRAYGLWFADKTGFYFQTYTVKAVYKQLEKNKKVEIYFYAPDPEGGPMGKAMRVSGEVEFVDDMEVKAKCLADRPFLQMFGVEKPEDPRLLIFRISKGEAYFWTMADNLNESNIKRIKF